MGRSRRGLIDCGCLGSFDNSSSCSQAAMLPLSVETPDQQPASPPRQSRRLRSMLLGGVCFVAATGALALGWNSAQPKFQAQVEKHRVLRELQSVPSLRLHFKVKRDTMRVHGLSEFDALANPVISMVDDQQRITYNGIATFADGVTTHTYKLVDGIAYYATETEQAGAAQESVTCLSSGLLPPVHEVLDAINSATHVGSVDGLDETINCPSGSLLKFQFADDTFAMCSTSLSSERGFEIYGSDLDIQVRYLANPVTIDVPAISAEMAATCEKIPDVSAVSTSTMNLLSGAGRDFVNRVFIQNEETLSLKGSSCSCKGARRPCVFFHGIDQEKEVGLVDSLDYWGDIAKHAPCCSSIKFAQLNTKDAGWNEDKLQQKVCDLSLTMSNSSNAATKTIENTILVAHSMGNLMIAGAIASGKCSLSKTSDWVAISGPMRGSIGSDFVQTICNGGNVGLDIVKAVVSLFGQCPAGIARKSLSYEGDQFCPPTLQQQYDAAQAVYKTTATAALCSNSYVGLLSLDQLTLILGGTIIPHKSKENDGIVEYQSCMADLPGDKFGKKYDQRFYKASVNHLDAAFRHGDALFNNAQKPVKWFECLL